MRTVVDTDGIQWQVSPISRWSFGVDGSRRMVDVLSIECIPKDGGSHVEINIPNLPLHLFSDAQVLHMIRKALAESD